MKQFLAGVVGVGVLVAALVGNYLFAQCFILRVNCPANPMAEIPKHMAAVASPLTLVAGGRGREETLRSRFSQIVGLRDQTLPETADAFVDISYVAKANPNPQPLDSVSGRSVNHLSYGYVGKDERYHQVTYYWGESDSTPSFLVRKVRGRTTGWGDYFVQYTVYISRDLKNRPGMIDSNGTVVRWEPPPAYPDIDRIDWSTYGGGSYDGFEELGFALVGTVTEAGVAAGVLTWRRRRRLTAAALDGGRGRP